MMAQCTAHAQLKSCLGSRVIAYQALSKQKLKRAWSPKCGGLPSDLLCVHTGDLFYAQMWSYTLTADQLYDNGYPRPTPEEGVAFLNREGDTIWKVQRVGPNAVRHECCRCRTPFIIYNDGQYQTVESCSYHYGRPYKNRGKLPVGRLVRRSVNVVVCG